MQKVFHVTFVDVYVMFALSHLFSKTKNACAFARKHRLTRDSAGACVARLSPWLDGQSCTFKRVEVFDAQIRWILDKRHTNNEQMCRCMHVYMVGRTGTDSMHTFPTLPDTWIFDEPCGSEWLCVWTFVGRIGNLYTYVFVFKGKMTTDFLVYRSSQASRSGICMFGWGEKDLFVNLILHTSSISTSK